MDQRSLACVAAEPALGFGNNFREVFVTPATGIGDRPRIVARVTRLAALVAEPTEPARKPSFSNAAGFSSQMLQ